jgi:hypothetical protein
MENGGATNGSGIGLPEIELIIKASTIDGKRKGADIFCQERIMMKKSLCSRIRLIQKMLF